jgi:hypothetical protein
MIERRYSWGKRNLPSFAWFAFFQISTVRSRSSLNTVLARIPDRALSRLEFVKLKNHAIPPYWFSAFLP